MPRIKVTPRKSDLLPRPPRKYLATKAAHKSAPGTGAKKPHPLVSAAAAAAAAFRPVSPQEQLKRKKRKATAAALEASPPPPSVDPSAVAAAASAMLGLGQEQSTVHAKVSDNGRPKRQRFQTIIFDPSLSKQQQQRQPIN
jgi:hypothetical protein